MSRLLNLVLLLSFVLLAACQKIPKPSGRVENPESPLLDMLLQPDDLPGNWKWAALGVSQPSQAKWIDQQHLVDSAKTDFAGELRDPSGNQFYISLYQTVAQYSNPVSVAQPFTLHPTLDEETTPFTPELNLPAHSRVLCFESHELIDCEVTSEFNQVLSVAWLITPVEFGKQATIDLLETIIQTTEDKIVQVQPK